MKELMNKHYFTIPIGDWSGDGHGKSRDFVIESNKSLEEVKEIYFQVCEKSGFALDGHGKFAPCSEYEEYNITADQAHRLNEIGINLYEIFDDLEFISEICDVIPDEFIELVLAFIRLGDPELEIKVLHMPQFQHYGYDEKKRHIGYFGYGLYE